MDWVTLLKIAPVVGLGGAAVAGVVLAWAYRGKTHDALALAEAHQARADELRRQLDAYHVEWDALLDEHKQALSESEALRKSQVLRLEAIVSHAQAEIASLEADLDASSSVPALRARLRRLLSPE